MRRYLDLVHDACKKKEVYLGCYNRDLTFFSLPVINEATRLFQQAENAVKDDAAILRRVRRDRLSLDHVWLIRYKQLRREAAKSGAPFLGPADPVKACEDFINAAHEWDARNATEGMGFDAYVPTLRSIVAPQPLPKETLDQIKAGRAEIPCEQFKLHQRPTLSDIVDDPKAKNGKAARMPGSTIEWAVHWQVPLEVDDIAGKWHCWAMVRCDAKVKSGPAFTCGIYDVENRLSVATLGPTLENVGDNEYHKIDFGVHELSSDMYLWVAPPGKADMVNAIYVDRVIIER